MRLARVCAAIWTQFTVDTGYRLTVCADRVDLDSDHNGDIDQLRSAKLDMVSGSHWRHTEIRLQRSKVMVTIHGEQKITASVPAPQLAPGKSCLAW